MPACRIRDGDNKLCRQGGGRLKYLITYRTAPQGPHMGPVIELQMAEQGGLTAGLIPQFAYTNMRSSPIRVCCVTPSEYRTVAIPTFQR